jgi:tRNA-dihydrouridine synthase 3
MDEDKIESTPQLRPESVAEPTQIKEEEGGKLCDLPPGVAPIKPQYIIRVTTKRQCSNKEESSETTPATDDPPPAKKRKRGQYKHRPSTKLEYSEQLCPSYHNGTRSCTFGDKCRYSHDVQDYLAKKPDDLGSHCYAYGAWGCCPSGLACRYGSAHISDKGENVINKDLYVSGRLDCTVRNVLDKSLQIQLRKKKVIFPRTERYLKGLETPVESSCSTEDSVTTASTGDVTADSTKDISTVANTDDLITSEPTSGVTQVQTCGPLTNEDTIKLKPFEKTKINFRGKLYLAPLTTVGNLPFRRICKNFGADITCGEMAMAYNLLQGQQSEWALLKRHESEDLFGVQVCGSFPDTMAQCAELIDTNCHVDFIDINVGCPIDVIVNKGCGSALMQRKGRFESIVRGMNEVIGCPLTVKMRTGFYSKKWNAHILAPSLRDWGVSLLTVHGRSREQRYTNNADWSYVNNCAELADPMPVFGNGDVLSFEDYYNNTEGKNIAGVMIARGALIKPWIFTEIKERRHWDISSSERLSILKDYSNYGLEHWGSDTHVI